MIKPTLEEALELLLEIRGTMHNNNLKCRLFRAQYMSHKYNCRCDVVAKIDAMLAAAEAEE